MEVFIILKKTFIFVIPKSWGFFMHTSCLKRYGDSATKFHARLFDDHIRTEEQVQANKWFLWRPHPPHFTLIWCQTKVIKWVPNIKDWLKTFFMWENGILLSNYHWFCVCVSVCVFSASNVPFSMWCKSGGMCFCWPCRKTVSPATLPTSIYEDRYAGNNLAN